MFPPSGSVLNMSLRALFIHLKSRGQGGLFVRLAEQSLGFVQTQKLWGGRRCVPYEMLANKLSRHVLADASWRAGLVPLVEAVVSEELEVEEVTQLLTAFARPEGSG